MTEVTTKETQERRMVQIPSDLLPFVESLRIQFGYERDSTTVNNCIRLTRNYLLNNGVEQYLALLNGDAQSN